MRTRLLVYALVTMCVLFLHRVYVTNLMLESLRFKMETALVVKGTMNSLKERGDVKYEEYDARLGSIIQDAANFCKEHSI